MAELDEHSKMYKNVGKGEQEASRRRRTEATIQLRREKRGNELNKRRNIDENAEYESEASDYDKDNKPLFKCSVPEAKQILLSNPSITDLRNVFEFLRKLLSRSHNPPVDEVVREGLVQALVQGLSVQDGKVQYEAAWALTNIVSGSSEHTQLAVKCGATMQFIQLAYSTDQAVAEQCLWGLANIIGDCSQLRDHAIECGCFDLLNHYLKEIASLKQNFVRTLAWLCSNICRHKEPQITREQIEIIIPALKVLLSFNDDPTRQDSAWALSYLTDTNDDVLALVMQFDILPLVRRLLTDKVPAMVAPAVRVFGNFVSGSDIITQKIIDMGIIKNEIPKVLKNTTSSVVKECCWLLSNVLAGTPAQIQSVIDAGVIPAVLYAVRHADFKVQSEAAWAISNLCHSGEHQQIYYLVEQDAFSYIVPVLTIRHVEFIYNLLASIKAMLNTISVLKPELVEHYTQHFEEIGGIDMVEDLQGHENARIYHICYDIIQTYFNEEEFENMDPSASHVKASESMADVQQPVFRF